MSQRGAGAAALVFPRGSCTFSSTISQLGNRKLKHAPPSALSLTPIVPPWSLTILRTIANPNPVPLSFPVTYG